MRNRIIWTIICIAAVLVVSCAPLDSLFGVDAQGNDLPGPSPAESGSGVIAPLLPTGSGGAPWGELGLGALLVLQNAYILIRKAQAKLGKKTT